MIINLTEQQILGAGGFGIVIQTDTGLCLKLLKDIDACKNLKHEIKIQKRIEEVLSPHYNEKHSPAKVPHIYEEFDNIITLKFSDVKKDYLCGILMDRIEPLYNNLQYHLAFGCELDDDINTVHYVNNTQEPRGFYGSVENLINLIEKNSVQIHESDSDKFIENLVIRMAKTYRYLLKANIIPFDIEFILDKNLQLWCLDFGLCYEINNSDDKSKHIAKILYNNEYIPCYEYLKEIFDKEFSKN